MLVRKEGKGCPPMLTQEERIKILNAAAPNSWIALSDDESRVVGRGSTYAAAVAEAEKNGSLDPLLIKTPED